MNKIILLLIFLSLSISAYSAIPYRIIEKTVSVGDGSTSDIKIEADIGSGVLNPYLKLDSTSGKWTFLNSGGTEKSLGSGGGSGGSGGINVLLNSGFEDGAASWINSGGTVSPQLYVNPTANDEKFLRFIASASGQYIEQVFSQWPDNISGGCMADFRQMQGDNSFIVKIIEDPSGANKLLSSYVTSDYSKWDKIPTSTFTCPAAGVPLAIRIEAIAAGVIDLDTAYLGSSKGFISGSSLEVTTTKILSADVAANTANVADLSFSNLTIGKEYVVKGRLTIDTGPSNDSFVLFLDAVAGNQISSSGSVNVGGETTGRVFQHISFEFTASTTSLIVQYVKTASANAVLRGDNTRVNSYLQLTEKPDGQQESYVPEQIDFMVEANVTGSDTAIGTSNDATFINISNAAATFTSIKGSFAATGATGGFSITGSIPVAAKYKVCLSFPYSVNASTMTTDFRIASCDGSSVCAVTGEVYSDNFSRSTIGQNIGIGVDFCRDMDIGLGQKTFSLQKQVLASAGVSFHNIDIAAKTQPFKWTIKMIGNNVSRPIIQNMVDTKVKSGKRIEACAVSNSGSPVTDTPDCFSWISGLVDVGLGITTMNINAGVFAGKPTCVATCNDANGNDCNAILTGSIWSATQVRVRTQTSSGGADVDRDFLIICTGGR